MVKSISSGSKPHTLPIPAVKSGTETVPAMSDESIKNMVRNGRELHNLEIKGLKVSIGEEQLFRAIDRAIKALEGPATSFEMKFHEETRAIMVKVINKDTGETIREFPPEKTLDLVVKMMEFAGILIDERI